MKRSQYNTSSLCFGRRFNCSKRASEHHIILSFFCKRKDLYCRTNLFLRTAFDLKNIYYQNSILLASKEDKDSIMNVLAVSTEERDNRPIEVFIDASTEEGFDATSCHWYNLTSDSNKQHTAAPDAALDAAPTATTSTDNEISSTKSECGDTTCSSITGSSGGKSDEARTNGYMSKSPMDIQDIKEVMMQTLSDNVDQALSTSFDLVRSLSNAMSFTPANSFQSEKDIQSKLRL